MPDGSALTLRHEDKVVQEHLGRVHSAAFNTYDLKDVVRYVTEKTYLKGVKYSFKDHEFQETILSDTSREVNVQKCAQIGMTEGMARYAVGVARIMPYFSVIMTMPHAGDASNFAKTRLDPIIAESPDVRDVMDPDLDNSEVKGIGTSLLYLRGTGGTTNALSVPADLLIHDELDRSDPDTIGQYQSRIKHSRWKLTRKFGTPTLEGLGIALAMESSRRKRHLCKCNHCNHWFAPNFHTDVKIPGYDGALRDINVYTLPGIDWQNAVLLCPKCGRVPSLQMEHREWVYENPGDNYEAVGYFVTPFSVPNVVSVPSLVREITKYKTWGEFVNQALGETLNSSEDQLVKGDIEACKYRGMLDSSELHCMGIDVGQTCHIVIGRITLSGELLVVHRERVVLARLRARRQELAIKYRVLITVIDAFPETNLVHELQKIDRNLYGGVYHDDKKLATYQIKMVEEDLAEGKLPINQAKIHRNVNFDEVMQLFKQRKLVWAAQEDMEDDIFQAHCLDMKRKQTLDRWKEMVYAWVKSPDGNDHYMHALGYLHVACRLMPAASANIPIAVLPMAGRIRVATKQETRAIGAMR